MVGLEICVDNPVSFINAVQGGADRIELCASLNTGGITPSQGFIEWALQNTPVPLRIMIRNRGGDFVYDNTDMAVMIGDIKNLPYHPLCEGIVFGALKSDNTVDISCVEKICAVTDLPCTFHRAFDWCREYKTALQHLATTNVDTVLTSGQKSDAWEALDTLAHMGAISGDMQIMSCAGFAPSPDRIKTLHNTAPAPWIHMAGATVHHGNISHVPMGDDRDSEAVFMTQTHIVQSVKQVIQTF